MELVGTVTAALMGAVAGALFSGAVHRDQDRRRAARDAYALFILAAHETLKATSRYSSVIYLIGARGKGAAGSHAESRSREYIDALEDLKLQRTVLDLVGSPSMVGQATRLEAKLSRFHDLFSYELNPPRAMQDAEQWLEDRREIYQQIATFTTHAREDLERGLVTSSRLTHHLQPAFRAARSSSRWRRRGPA